MDYPQRVAGVDDELEGADRPRAWIEVGRWPTAARADEYALVLQAMGIRSAVAPIEGTSGNQHQLIVQVEDAERARDQLRTFTGENRGWPPRSVRSPLVTTGVGAALVYVALMIIAFAAARRGSYGVDWLSAGSADAGLIRSGEWWRVVTALSLHADVVHLAGNLLFGALFGVMLAQSVGSGSTWLTFVVAGGIGNWVNAWWQSPAHLAIGASTGVFGLLGAQVSCDWIRRGRIRHHPMRRWAPIIMGFALLAWFGGSGERQVDLGNVNNTIRDLSELQRVDVAAHVFGFCAGLGVGALLAQRTIARLETPRAQGALTATAIGLIALAWALAVR